AFQNMLRERGLDLTVTELPDSTRTADDAAHALGCTKAQIVKSLVFRTVHTGPPVLVLASGDNRVNEHALPAHVGEPNDNADAKYVKAASGYVIGGVPPVGHATAMRVFVDKDLLSFDTVWAAAGTPHAVVQIPAPLKDILDDHTVIALT